MTTQGQFTMPENFNGATMMMNDKLREEVHSVLTPCSEEEFFFAYCEKHLEKFGEIFEPAKPNGTW
ncbi:MAG: hypothetical protein ACRC46_13315 [Thermoguttaceae bacterium]